MVRFAAAYQHRPSLKTALATICSVITANMGMVSDGCGVYWRARMAEAIKASAELAANNVASPELLAKWIDYDTIKIKVNQLLTDEGHTNKRMSQNIVLLAVYAYLAPKRLGLGKLAVVQAEAAISMSTAVS